MASPPSHPPNLPPKPPAGYGFQGQVRQTPLAPGSVSLRLYPHDLAPGDVVAELMTQARLAEASGFDGVMLSEHHGGFANYVPNPLLAATWALEATERIWAAPCPLLLPLRPPAQVVEDLAWTAQRFPGRVGAGFAAGALPLDFALSGVPFDEMVPRFKAALPEVAAALAGRAEGVVAADPAVAALAETPIPAVSAAQSPAAARRAAATGLGLLFDSIISTVRAAEVTEAFGAAGGQGPRILIRRAWVGSTPEAAVEAQMARFRRAAPDAARAHWAEDGGLVAAPEPSEVAERLVDQLVRSGCDTLNLRVFHAGIGPAEARHQIEVLGAEVVPRLRAGAGT
jgi:alkanesulfonate monooxygenase SsuD/methylene tetrahydromethanopterin reductase-like flavin-dependent oxidoreductase (luciferase family)